MDKLHEKQSIDEDYNKGIVFLADGTNLDLQKDSPYLCKIWGGNLWLFYWHSSKRWVSLRETNLYEASTFPRNLTLEHQDLYLHITRERM